jgi:succinate dehydrogenase hydrophobic anchor subunit
MANRPPAWVDPLMRFGYVARRVVYLLVGALAFVASVDGGRTPDSKSALGALLQMPFGKVLLALIALGLLAYALWCFINAGFDLDGKGDGAKGWTARAAKTISGVVHVVFAVSVSALALGSASPSGGDDRTEHWTAVLMQQPLGRWLVALVGVIAIAIGVQHFVKALREKYKDSIRYTEAAQRLNLLLKLGLIAHGVVVVLVGVFCIWAAGTADPSRAGGMRDALLIVRKADASQTLFAAVGVGLLGFAAYCFVEAMFRIIPRCAPPDLETLATRARARLARD